MTFGYSRDDAEGGFLLKYVEDGILPGQPVPDARRRGRRPDEDRGRQGPRDAARHRARASAASTAATRSRSTSASRSGSTTCPARRSACRSRGSRRPRRRWRPSTTSRSAVNHPAGYPARRPRRSSRGRHRWCNPLDPGGPGGTIRRLGRGSREALAQGDERLRDARGGAVAVRRGARGRAPVVPAKVRVPLPVLAAAAAGAPRGAPWRARSASA